jgi:iron complex transport system substrate-binding protein
MFSRYRLVGLVLALTLTLLAGACGNDDGDTSGAEGAATDTAATDTTDTAETDTTGTEDAAPAVEQTTMTTPIDGLSVTVNADGSRTITHPAGETTIPAERPARIAVTGDPLTDSLVSIGIEPSAATADYGTEFTEHLADLLPDDVEIIEWAGDSVNLEQLALADPDLILTEIYGAPDSVWDAVTQIAPAISFGDPWASTSKDVVTTMGMVFGLEDEAAAAIARYEEKVAETRERIAPVVDDRNVVFVQVYADELRLVTPTYGYLGPLLFGDLGLEAFAYEGDATSLSPELLGELTADVMILQPDFDSEELLGRVLDSPLLASLPSSREGRVFAVEGDTAWQTWSAVGLNANTAVLQALEDLLATG